MKNSIGFFEKREDYQPIKIERIIEWLYGISTEKYSSDFLRAVNDVIHQLETQRDKGMKGDDFFENVCIETFVTRGEYNEQEEYIGKGSKYVIDIDKNYLIISEEWDVCVRWEIDIDQQKIEDSITEWWFYQKYIELPNKVRVYIDEYDNDRDHELEYRFIPLNWEWNRYPKKEYEIKQENKENKNAIKPWKHREMVWINNQAKGRMRTYIDTIQFQIVGVIKNNDSYLYDLKSLDIPALELFGVLHDFIAPLEEGKTVFPKKKVTIKSKK